MNFYLCVHWTDRTVHVTSDTRALCLHSPPGSTGQGELGGPGVVPHVTCLYFVRVNMRARRINADDSEDLESDDLVEAPLGDQVTAPVSM